MAANDTGRLRCSRVMLPPVTRLQLPRDTPHSPTVARPERFLRADETASLIAGDSLAWDPHGRTSIRHAGKCGSSAIQVSPTSTTATSTTLIIGAGGGGGSGKTTRGRPMVAAVGPPLQEVVTLALAGVLAERAMAPRLLVPLGGMALRRTAVGVALALAPRRGLVARAITERRQMVAAQEATSSSPPELSPRPASRTRLEELQPLTRTAQVVLFR
jgi:hypothetical protein